MKRFIVSLVMLMSGPGISATLDCYFHYGDMNADSGVSKSFSMDQESAHLIDLPGLGGKFMVGNFHDPELDKAFMTINKQSELDENDYNLVASGYIAFDGSVYRLFGTTDQQTKIAILECRSQNDN